MRKWPVLFFLISNSIIAFSQGKYNPNIIPLGDEEALLANTGTGGIGSSGAVFYNPGALGMLEGTYVSLSGTAYTQFNLKAEPLVRFGESNINYEASGFLTIPTSFIVVRQKKDWRFAFSILVPYEFDYEGPTNWDVNFNGLDLDLKLHQNFREKIVLSGLSAARKLGKNWSIGISAFWQNYNQISSLNLTTTTESDPSFIVESFNRETINVNNLLLIMGIQKSFDKWSFGLKLDLPSLKMISSGEYYDFNYSNTGSITNRSIIDNDSLNPNFFTPLSIRSGASFQVNDKIRTCLDISYAFDHSYNAFEDMNLNYNYETERKANLRYSLGAQFDINEAFTLYVAGSRSATRLNGQSRIFNTGFAAIKWNTSKIQSSLGLFYGIGSNNTEVDVDLTGTEEISLYGVYLGTSYHF